MVRFSHISHSYWHTLISCMFYPACPHTRLFNRLHSCRDNCHTEIESFAPQVACHEWQCARDGDSWSRHCQTSATTPRLLFLGLWLLQSNRLHMALLSEGRHIAWLLALLPMPKKENSTLWLPLSRNQSQRPFIERIQSCALGETTEVDRRLAICHDYKGPEKTCKVVSSPCFEPRLQGSA